MSTFPFPNFLAPIEADGVIWAQENLPYFLENLSHPRRSMNHFSVLASHSSGDQLVWLTELHCKGDRIRGRIGSTSGGASLTGQEYETSLKSVADWLFVHNYRLIGASSFRQGVFDTLEYMEYLCGLTQGAPTRPEPSEEDQVYYERVVKFCLPLNEELRSGPKFELFDTIGNHENREMRRLLSDRQLINEPCEVIAWYVISVHRVTLSPLLYAINCENEAAAVHLIEAGAQLELQDDLGMTALHRAAQRFPSLVRLLVDKGANLTAREEGGCTPLDTAIVNNSHECIRILLQGGADVNGYHEQLSPRSTNRIVVSPVLSGGLDLPSAVILSEAGANFDVRNHRGKSPLHIAANNGRFDLAEFLIAQGCDPKERADNGETPVTLALKYREDDPEAIRFVDYCKKH